MTAQPAPISGPAKTIDEVIAHLDEIIACARREQSRLGYFATLYRNVTIEVKRGIANGNFEHSPRMERLDVTFANRYLTALEACHRRETASQCWTTAFKITTEWAPIVLQHLLLGMNAHINLDLGVAAATVCPGDQLPSLQHDFDEINNILEAMIIGVRLQLEKISPWLKLLDFVGGRTEDVVLNWSITKARDAAWSFAQHLAPLDAEQFAIAIAQRDRDTCLLTDLIRSPGALISAVNLIVRFSEPRRVARILEMLA